MVRNIFIREMLITTLTTTFLKYFIKPFLIITKLLSKVPYFETIFSKGTLNPFNAEAIFVKGTRTQKLLKTF